MTVPSPPSLDTESELDEYEYAEANARRLENLDGEGVLHIQDPRVVRAAAEESLDDIAIGVWVDINDIELSEGDIYTSHTAPLAEGATTIVDALGTDGVFRELFLLLDEGTVYSKSKISEDLRCLLTCINVDTEPGTGIECVIFQYRLEPDVLGSI